MRTLSLAAPSWSKSADERQPVLDPSLRVEVMVRDHIGAVWRVARDLGVPDREREDVSQEVMLVALRRLSDIEPGRERAFLLATTVRVVSNWRRGHRRRPAELTACMDEQEPTALAGQETFVAQDTAVERNEEWELVQQALESMTETQREAFVLFELEQLSGKEIAESLGLTEPTVFARIGRARLVFRRFCDKSRNLTGESR